MLYIAAGLLVVWILGVISSFTVHGIIHVLPILALVMLVLNFDNGRRICG